MNPYSILSQIGAINAQRATLQDVAKLLNLL